MLTFKFEDKNELQALISALDSYLNGNGMDGTDEDEPVLEAVLSRLNEV